MKKLQLWGFALILASTLFPAVTQQGHANPDRLSINTNGLVRVVYFLPSDRTARPDRMAALRQLIKDAQQFYADEMHRHGFGKKTFTVETDNNGEPLVHQINGKFREEYYDKNVPDFKVWEELLEHFKGDDLQHVYFIAIDLSSELLDKSCGLGGASFFPIQGNIGFGPAGKAKLRHRDITMGEELLGGFALIPASGTCFGHRVTVHELGHAFGIDHDFRAGRHSDYVMSFGNATRLSKCAAEWLSVSRFFNTKSNFRNAPGEIQLLSLRTYSQDTISFRFKVTDPDGLHQFQLLVPDILKDPRWAGWGPYRLFDCKRLNGTTGTVESVVRTAELVDRITLQIIDVGGNITWATFPIQLDEIDPAQNALDVNSDGVVNLSDLATLASRFGQRGQDPADVNANRIIDIVDVLLVAASISSLPRQVVETFTAADVQKWLTDAKQLEVENEILKEGIVRLEHLLAVLTAVVVDIPNANLRAAVETALKMVSGASILSSDMETLTRLEARNANISDLTGLEHATNLTYLNLEYAKVEGRRINSNSVSNLLPLAGLTKLTRLHLWGNSISDISPLTELTNLTLLDISDNRISDISPVAGLINLTLLDIDGNPLSDISPVAGLTNLTFLDIWGTPISDISPVTGLTNLTLLGLGWNNISDLSPLIANTGLGDGDRVVVIHNPLSYLSIHTHIPALQSRGVTVEFDADGTRPPDVNSDGNINVLDLILIASEFGNTGEDIAADVSGDGIVNVLDIVLVAGTFEDVATAPSAQPQAPEMLTAVEVRQWLIDAKSLEGSNPIIKRGILVLEQFLVSLTPTKTELLPNYPNPFNPETWIPYRLAEDADVKLIIYDTNGRVVRTLNVGHRIASIYENRSKAIYWNGRNGLGEQVASGVYFYTLTAGDFSATRRMVILK